MAKALRPQFLWITLCKTPVRGPHALEKPHSWYFDEKIGKKKCFEIKATLLVAAQLGCSW
jgi:hypothetical protein